MEMSAALDSGRMMLALFWPRILRPRPRAKNSSRRSGLCSKVPGAGNRERCIRVFEKISGMISTPTLLHNPWRLEYSSLRRGAKSEQESASIIRRCQCRDISIKKLTLSDASSSSGHESQKRSTYDHVDVTASDVSILRNFSVTVTADLPSGGKFKLVGTVGPVDQAELSSLRSTPS